MEDSTKLGEQIAFQLWAKTHPKTNQWHALPFHLADVGATASTLWNFLPEGSRRTAIRAFHDPELAKKVVTFLAAIHDLGKANLYFQGKDARQHLRLQHLNVSNLNEPQRHGEATTALLIPWFKNNWSWKNRPANTVAIAVGGHHGCFHQDLHCERLKLSESYVPAVSEYLLTILETLHELPKVVPEPDNLNAFLPWLAGFVSVADWLGSHEQMTVWQTEPYDLATYKVEAEARARALFEDLNWTRTNQTPPLPIQHLVPTGFEPNGLQSLAAKVAQQDFGLAIIEAPTGEGKTEAAFALCERGRSEGAGIFFALPTMATANGIHGRVNSYLKEATGAPDLETKLLHSQAWLHRSNLETLSNPKELENQEAAEDYFVGGKRGLLAPYASGTIDQALVGALRAKHGFVRLFALAGKSIVVDEVHAYDIYMGDLLERLLGWLRVLGCRVLLLSATLPESRRESLIKAWGGTASTPLANYPCITWVSPSLEASSETFQISPRKSVRFDLLPSREIPAWRAGAEKIYQLIEGSHQFGCLILNTVGDAQKAYQHLKQLVGNEVQVDLFHARFTLEDRKLKEDYVLNAFGKSGSRGKPRILVATQVVEQSLDLDFDQMVSALAPVDLLIQRAGRLHRHKRTAAGHLQTTGSPDERPVPTLHIISPNLTEEGVADIRDRVYDHDILLRTHHFLESGFVISGPSDVSAAVNTVYDFDHQVDAREAFQERLDAATAKANAKRETHHEKAGVVMICKPTGSELITGCPNGYDDDENAPASQIAAKTRLEEHLSANLILIFDQELWPPLQYDHQTKRHLALRTVRTPLYGEMLSELEQLEKPPDWHRSGASKYAFPVQLDSSGQCETAGHRICYNQEVGLTIETLNA